MTKQEANRMIAEWCGLKLCPEPDSHWHQAGFNPLHDGCTVRCPDFFTSTEACGRVKEKLGDVLKALRVDLPCKGRSIAFIYVTLNDQSQWCEKGSTECIAVALMALRIITGGAVEVAGVE